MRIPIIHQDMQLRKRRRKRRRR